MSWLKIYIRKVFDNYINTKYFFFFLIIYFTVFFLIGNNTLSYGFDLYLMYWPKSIEFITHFAITLPITFLNTLKISSFFKNSYFFTVLIISLIDFFFLISVVKIIKKLKRTKKLIMVKDFLFQSKLIQNIIIILRMFNPFNTPLKKKFMYYFFINFFIIISILIYTIGFGFGFSEKEYSKVVSIIASIWVFPVLKILESFIGAVFLKKSSFLIIIIVSLIDTIFLLGLIAIVKKIKNLLKKHL